MGYMIYQHMGKLELIADQGLFETNVSFLDAPEAVTVELMHSPSGDQTTVDVVRLLLIGNPFDIRAAQNLAAHFMTSGDNRYLGMLASLSLVGCNTVLFTDKGLAMPCDHITGGRRSPAIPWSLIPYQDGALVGSVRSFGNLLTALAAVVDQGVSADEVIDHLDRYNLLSSHSTNFTRIDVTLPSPAEPV